ncbi:MAG TPA: LysE family transporter [Flavobacteriaceae bacterium]|nr:LysE family transporter [Flavobacteriaceae bacterium]
MDITLTFILGLVIALIGVIPPGLLNMTAAKISMKEGHNRGFMFSAGACTIVIFQTAIAAVFAKYLSNHPDVIEVLQRVAFVIFVLIAIYFLLLANKQSSKPQVEAEAKSMGSRFFQGVLLSALNVFPIPFQAYMTLTLASFGWMTFDKISIISYVSGAVMGTFVMLYIYILFFDKIKGKSFTSQKNMNLIIGAITGSIAIITLINIIKEL